MSSFIMNCRLCPLAAKTLAAQCPNRAKCTVQFSNDISLSNLVNDMIQPSQSTKIDNRPSDTGATYSWLFESKFENNFAPVTYDALPKRTWGRKEVREEIISKPANWNKMLSDDVYLQTQLFRLLSYGLLFIQMVPTQQRQDALRLIQNRRRTNVFQVSSETFTPLSNVSTLETGEYILCDGFKVSQQLKEQKKHLYNLLTTHPVEFIGNENQTESEAKTIETDRIGRVCKVNFNSKISSWLFDTQVAEVDSMIQALKTFNQYCYQERNMLRIKINPGEMLWSSNSRVLALNEKK